MPAVLLIVFIVIPVLELYVIFQVSDLIGGWWTVAALLAISVAGAALVKREGLRAWSRFRDALAGGRLPAAEVTDGAVILAAGAMLLAPGFVTDAVGLVLLLPPTRALIGRLLRQRVRSSIGLGGGWPLGSGRPGRRTDDLDVEVVDVRRTEPPQDGGSDAIERGGR